MKRNHTAAPKRPGGDTQNARKSTDAPYKVRGLQCSHFIQKSRSAKKKRKNRANVLHVFNIAVLGVITQS